ncbi:MAG: RluA family pseudouridine synthase [Sulfuricurvum sp.]
MPFVTKHYSIKSPVKSLDFLTHELGYNRSEAQRLIHRGRLTQNDIVIDNPFSLLEGEVGLLCFEALSQGLDPVYETQHFAVYDKPSGLRVHPYSRRSPYTLNDEIKSRYGNDANAAHRIDQETSGLVLVTLNKNSEAVIKCLFSERYIVKKYLAMVRGEIKTTLNIDAPLLHHDHPNMAISMVVKVDPKGKHAQTVITPIRYFPELDATLIEASPLTGRTHQIRVHLFHVKHPIIGDPIYGQSENTIERYRNLEISREERLMLCGAKRLLLHAHSLEFDYDAQRYRIESNENFIETCFRAMGKNID